MGGIHPDALETVAGDYRMDSGYEAAEMLLNGSKRKRPTALMCANDLMAIGAMEYCRANGICVPDDVSITGFDDIPIANLLTPRLTTASQPAYHMGRQAADLLIKLIEGRAGYESPDPHPVNLVVRESSTKPEK